MKKFNYEIWFVTGSQSLYGEEILKRVADDSRTIVEALDSSPAIPVRIVFRPVLTTADAITKLCLEANSNKLCAGIITWMHTFSPAKMWIAGLSKLDKPMLHLHTQFNRDIPWGEIDMNFMNLNQSAHGDREFGFICSRLRLRRKVVTGHWQDSNAISEIAVWARAAVASVDARSLKVARFGDNMRDVAVTEGNKVSAQLMMGYEVHGYGVGDLVQEVNDVDETAIRSLLEQYREHYLASESVLNSLR